MEVIIASSPRQAGSIGADLVEAQLARNPASAIGLATGSSPQPMYRELIARCAAGRLSFAQTRAFLLDEYVGLPDDHPESYRRFIERELTSQIDLPSSALAGPDGSTRDLDTAGSRYEQLLEEAGGIDLQILGIGRNGHIGFNEPTSSLMSRTRLKMLADTTRRDNARFFGGDLDLVPRHTITQGIATILDARHVVLIATGSAKAEPIRLMVEGPLTAMVPASALQLHPHATIILDEESAADLATAAYHRETYAQKPAGRDSS